MAQSDRGSNTTKMINKTQRDGLYNPIRFVL